MAQINGEIITLGEFERRMEGMAPHARVRYSTPERQRELLDSLVVFELLADEAERQGLRQDPAVAYATKEVMVRHLLERELRRSVSMRDISEDDVRRAYEAERALYERPEQRRAAAIILDSPQALEALLEAERLPLDSPPELGREALAARMTHFRRLAAKHGQDADVARAGGDLGFVEPPHVAKARLELSTALFKLERIGQISPPVELQGRWFALMLTDKKPAYRQPIDEVTRQLRERLYEERRRQKREEILAQLRAQGRVQIFEDVLAKVEPPPIPGHVIRPDTTLKGLPVRGLEPSPPAEPDAPDEATTP